MKTIKSIRQNKPLKEGFKSRATKLKVTGYVCDAKWNSDGSLTITSEAREVFAKPYKRKQNTK